LRLSHALLDRSNPLILIGLQLAKPRLDVAQAVAVFFRQADKIGHLPFEGIEPLRQRHDRRLGRGGVIGKARRVRGASLGKYLPLHLLDLAFKPIQALFRSWGRLALCKRDRRRQRHCGTGRESGDQLGFHEYFPSFRFVQHFARTRLARR
jgi:hypothetical protein